MWICFVFALCLCGIQSEAQSNEVIYHIFMRSFCDSNGDSQGDLKGLQSKIGYLKKLGVTSILLTPLQSSIYYHNYFSDDFEKIDPEFGTIQDYLALVKDLHRHGMRIYLDMETQYVSEDHVWWKNGVGNLNSPYRDFILYDDDAHLQPGSIIYNVRGFTGYDGVSRKLTTANLRSPEVLTYNIKLFSTFVDPNQDGNFEDGADGFRLDHAMDTLDGKPALADLFVHFWRPLIEGVKAVNPKVKFIAEQADWLDYGTDYYNKAQVDHVFAFAIRFALAKMDKQSIANAIEQTIANTPTGKQQIVFIENHDMARFASLVHEDQRALKAGAAINLLIGQVPSIYYGQELGMAGVNQHFNNTDANDIPVREAFEWNASDTGFPMAIWYKNSGPWWDQTHLKPFDGISLEEEKRDPNSTYNFYRKLLRLRQKNKTIQQGAYITLINSNPNTFSFIRQDESQTILVLINLSAEKQDVVLDFAGISFSIPLTQSKLLLSSQIAGKGHLNPATKMMLQPYEVDVWKL